MSKKAWLIGCGGCLGLTVIVVILLAIGGIMLGGSIQGEMAKSTKAIFGEKLPDGYIGFGVSAPDKKAGNTKQDFAILMNALSGKMLMAFTGNLSTKDIELLQNASDEELKPMFEAALKASQSQEADTIQQIKPSHLTLNGQSYPCFRVMVSSKSRETAPMSAAILIYPQNKTLYLMLLDVKEEPLGEAEFDKTYSGLETEMSHIIETTALIKDLQYPKSTAHR